MTGEPLIPISPLRRIRQRLPAIFPDGTPHRNYLIRDIAARAIFVMLYVGAVEGAGRWLRPNQVTRMTDAQARKIDDEARIAWTKSSLQKLTSPIRGRWYADNTREPIRDETIRVALVPLGAVVERPNLAVTSQSPRYALAADFADLFVCPDQEFGTRAATWQALHLSAGARARIAVMRRGAVIQAGTDRLAVRFPNGEVRHVSAGPSSVISRAVIEEFAPRFLVQPGVILLSESREKIVARDDELARSIGIQIFAAKVLPDILLVDLGTNPPLLVFVEVVATDGAVTEGRRDALRELATTAGFAAGQTAFITACFDRSSPGYKRVVTEIAWGTFVWFASEPTRIVAYHETTTTPVPLSTLLARV